MTSNLNYDIIGDIHGYAESLEQLLSKLNYIRINGVYQNPHRKVVFLGDFIDRGPKIRETLHIVKDMVDAGHALAVMGNHEYNAVCFHTKNKHQGGYYRDHSLKEIEQHLETLKQFKHFQTEWNDFLNWFRHLPMFLELPEFNAVHAYWNPNHISWLKVNYHPEKEGLTDEFLALCNDDGGEYNKKNECIVVDETLKGPEMPLPNDLFMIDKEGVKRKECRLKWWAPSKKTWGESLMECPDSEKNQLMIDQKYTGIFTADKPVFFGHYWLKGTPEEENKWAICLDYSIAKHGKLVAYQFDQKKFIWV